MDFLKEYHITSTYHGVKDWYKGWVSRSIILKCFWTFILIAAFAAVVYYNYVLVVQYLTYSTASKITPMKVDKIQFPNITIGPSSKLNKTYIVDSQYIPPMYAPFLPIPIPDMKIEFVKYILLTTFDILYVNNFTQSKVESLEKMYQNSFNKSVNDKAVDVISYLKNNVKCPQFLKGCWYNTKPFDCCSNFKFLYGSSGLAYQIQLPTSEDENVTYQSQAGMKGGVKIVSELNVNHTLLTPLPAAFGVYAVFSDYYSAFEFSPALVPGGMHAFIKLSAKKYVIDPTLRLCLKNPYPVTDGVAYTKGLCQTRCLLNMTLKSCGCRPYLGYVFTEPSPETFCSPLQMLTCVLPLLLGSTKDAQISLNEASDCMTNNCPLLCEYWIYSPSVTYNKMTQGNDSNIVSTGVTIFFGELSYDLMEEILLMDINGFISNVGNIFGLYTGVSVISVIQCLALCILLPCKKQRGDPKD